LNLASAGLRRDVFGETTMHAHALPLLAAAAIGLVGLTTPLPALAQGALKPVEALVVNPTNRPVPVQVLSAPAPEGEGSRENFVYASVLNIEGGFGCAVQTVPAGKRLVLQHIGGQATLTAPAALVSVITRLGSASYSDLVVPAAPPLTALGMNQSAAGQQVHAYYDHSFQVCGSLSGEAYGRMGFYLRGYLVNKP
jgi:hypothetical protein